MAETRDQKREWDGISLPLSNSSGRPSKRVDRDEWKTWSTLDLLSAENAGSPQQGRNPCMVTEAWYDSTYGCHGLCRLLRQYRQRDKRRRTEAKPALFGRKHASGT